MGYCAIGQTFYRWLQLPSRELKPLLTHCSVLTLLGKHVVRCPDGCKEAYDASVRPRLTRPIDPTIPETAWVRPQHPQHVVSAVLGQ